MPIFHHPQRPDSRQDQGIGSSTLGPQGEVDGLFKIHFSWSPWNRSPSPSFSPSVLAMVIPLIWTTINGPGPSCLPSVFSASIITQVDLYILTKPLSWPWLGLCWPWCRLCPPQIHPQFFWVLPPPCSNPSVPLQGYLIPVISVLVILAVLGVLVNHRLRHLDMLEAPKSGGVEKTMIVKMREYDTLNHAFHLCKRTKNRFHVL